MQSGSETATLQSETTSRRDELSERRPRGFTFPHPVLAYYALTFAISWGGVLMVVGGPGGIPATSDQIARLMPLAIVFMLFGPSIAGVLMTALVDGKKGLHELLSHLLMWRVGAPWYAVALLTAPVVYTVVLGLLSLSSPAFLPGIIVTHDKLPFLLVGTAPGLLVGFLEELGWTGFAIPRLRLRYGVVVTGLIAGVLWGAWHILTNDLWAAAIVKGEIPLGVYVMLNGFGMLIGQLPAFRLLMVWMYDRTGSLLLAMLMHASLVFSTFVLGPVGLTGVSGLVYGYAIGGAMWLVVALVATRKGAQFSQIALRTRVV